MTQRKRGFVKAVSSERGWERVLSRLVNGTIFPQTTHSLTWSRIQDVQPAPLYHEQLELCCPCWGSFGLMLPDPVSHFIFSVHIIKERDEHENRTTQMASSAIDACTELISASEYTATVLMPKRWHVRITLQAISPLLAMRILSNSPAFELLNRTGVRVREIAMAFHREEVPPPEREKMREKDMFKQVRPTDRKGCAAIVWFLSSTPRGLRWGREEIRLYLRGCGGFWGLLENRSTKRRRKLIDDVTRRRPLCVFVTHQPAVSPSVQFRRVEEAVRVTSHMTRLAMAP